MGTGANARDMQATSLVRPGLADETFRHIGPWRLNRDAYNYMIERIVDECSVFADAAFGDPSDIASIVGEFFESFLSQHHALQLPAGGSTSVGGLLQLYLVAKKLAPAVVVESGVFVGASLHALRRAAPDAAMFAFDVSFGPLRYKDSSITYHETDWAEVEGLSSRGKVGLAFFDDHINNATRVLEAHERGFKHLVFDDAPHLFELLSYRYPGVPTIPMLIDGSLKEDVRIEWQHGGEWLRYEHEPRRWRAAAEKIMEAVPLPDLRSACGLFGGHKWYVRLR